jgi:hypothetical protein
VLFFLGVGGVGDSGFTSYLPSPVDAVGGDGEGEGGAGADGATTPTMLWISDGVLRTLAKNVFQSPRFMASMLTDKLR